MMKFIQSAKHKYLTGVIIAVTLSLVSLIFQQNWIGKSQSIVGLNAGLNTCYNRVTQTFTSIMIQQVESSYLTREFTELTSSCFNDVQKQFQQISSGLMANNLKNINGKLNQLVSDTHWFHEKVLKVKKMSADETVNLTNSNVLSKYSSLEEIKDSLQEQIELKRSEVEKRALYFQIFGFICIILSGCLGTIWFMNAHKNSLRLREVESIAENMLKETNIPSDIPPEKIDRIMEMAFGAANLPKTLQLVQHYQLRSPLLQYRGESFEQDISKDSDHVVSDQNIRTAQAVTNLNNAFNAALKGVQSKAFTYGVIVDFDLDDDLMVYGEQEDLQQVIYTLMNYAIDSSMHHNQGRKIIIRSKALGGTIYFKASITNHCFNASELEYLTDNNSQGTDVNINLVMIKELASVNNTEYKVTNKVNSAGELKGSEVEFIFQRADVLVTCELESLDARDADRLEKNRYVSDFDSDDISELGSEETQKQLSSIIKGSKKEILARFKNSNQSNQSNQSEA